MPRLPGTEPIEFLVNRKFADSPAIRTPETFFSLPNNANKENEFKKIKDYESELRSMPHEDLQRLFKAELDKSSKEHAEKMAAEEPSRFYNQPSAEADFEHWSRATYWTLDEAIALSFGKDPEVVNWEKINHSPSSSLSPFVKKYRKRRDLVLRAKNLKQLYDPYLPGLFLAWAQRNRMDVSEKIIKKVEAQGVVIADWKNLHDKLKVQFDSLNNVYIAKAEELEQLKASNSSKSSLDQSEYWKKIERLAQQAIEQYPVWRDTQKRKIQKTGNLQDWLLTAIHADNREAEILKKVLSDFFNELR